MNSADQIKEEYAWASTTLGIIFAMPPVVSLIEAHFHVHLNFGFAQFVEFYRLALQPVVDHVEAPFRWLIEQLHLHWTIPQWLKDLHVLSFVMAGLYSRGWLADSVRAAQERDFEREQSDLLDWQQRVASASGFVPALPRGKKSPFLKRGGPYLRIMAYSIFIGFVGAGLFVWLIELISSPLLRRIPKFERKRLYRGRTRFEWVPISQQKLARLVEEKRARTILWLRHLRSFLLTLFATVAAVIAFYACNAVLTQLGFH